MATGDTDVTPEMQAMAIAEDVLARLPDKILSGPSHEGDIKPSDMTPMSIVVIQEAARYDRLVNVVRSSAKAVIGAVQGKCIECHQKKKKKFSRVGESKDVFLLCSVN